MAQNNRPDGPPESITLAQFKGLKNTVGTERLAPDELQRAQNIDIDDVGQIRRRRGFALKSAGDYHSLWASSSQVYVVKNGDLGVLYPDYSFTSLTTVGPERLAYCEVDNVVYFSSSTASGKIVGGAVQEWGAVDSAGTWLSPVVNPSSTLFEIRGRLLGKPPMATALTYYRGRIFLANEKVVWATELYLYDYIEKTKNYLPFEHDVTMLGAVSDGVYVGTTSGVSFLSGNFSEGMRRTPVLKYGALPGSMVYAPAEKVRPQTSMSRSAILFMTTGGLMAGLDEGVVYNLTDDRFDFPEADSVAALFRETDGMNSYVGVVDSGGTPGSSARIGDYVDAEIRRFQGA